MDSRKSDIIKSLLQQKIADNKDYSNAVLNYSFKDSKLSNKCRAEGNVLYGRNDNPDQYLEESHSMYSKSVAYAPPGSNDLELAYGNRSATLQRMNKYEDSISDINRALKIGKSDIKIKIKILCRKVECLAALGLSDCQKVLEEIKTLLPQLDDQSNNNNPKNPTEKNFKKALDAVKNFSISHNLKKNEDTLEHIRILNEKENKNPVETYTIQNDKIIGRQLIANRDIEPGEIIMVERPYVCFVKSSHFTNYCGHCFKKTWSSIPCDQCTWCMFCSEECKKLAFINYHDIECPVISNCLNDTNINYCDQLSLRSLIMGMREAENISDFINEMKAAEKLLDEYENGSLGDVVYYSNGFKSVFTLGNKISNERFGKYIPPAEKMLILLAKCTSFFGKKFDLSNSISENVDVLYIGLVLVKLIHKFNTYALQFQCEKSNKSRTGFEKEYSSWGACVTPLTSFINHTCNPNAKACITNDQKLIVYSLQPIKKNSQILMGYQYTFFEMEKQIRNNWFKKNFNAVCNCKACFNNWPTITKLYEMPRNAPREYAMTYKQKESDLFDENDSLINPIINGHDKARFNQGTVRKLVKSMNKALKCLDQPSVVLCELMISLSITFEKLYGSNLLR